MALRHCLLLTACSEACWVPASAGFKASTKQEGAHGSRRVSFIKIHAAHHAHHAHPSYALSIINMLACGTALGLMLLPRSITMLRVRLSTA